MKTYSVSMTEDARADVEEIRDYFLDVMHAPGTAALHLQAIREEVASLRTLPSRYPLFSEEPWHSRGIRVAFARKYYLYYRVYEDASAVYVLNVVLASRDQLTVLQDRDSV